MITFLISALKIIFVLGFLITIHETGHFLVAKWCKVKVNQFSIGFGPIIWKKQGKETKYSIRLIPLGGFVQMEGEEERSESEGSFSKASIPKRVAIVAAGGLVNIVFALCIYFILMASVGNNISTTVGDLIPEYAAQSTDIQVGDTIKKINQKTIRRGSDLNAIVAQSQGEELTIVLERDGQEKEIKLIPTRVPYKDVGIYLKSSNQGSTKILMLEPNGPAEIAGMQTGDTVTKIEEQDVKDNPEKLLQLLNKAFEEKETIAFTVERNGEIIDISIKPEEKANYYLGVYLKKAENTLGNNLYYAFFDTGDFAFSIIDNLKQLFTGKVSMDQFVGPVGISEIVSETSGVQEFIYILSLISLSLGVTNLLPIPALDGGKLLLLLIEAIRRKPLKEKTEINIQMLGFAILIAISLYVTYHDIIRIF